MDESRKEMMDDIVDTVRALCEVLQDGCFRWRSGSSDCVGRKLYQMHSVAGTSGEAYSDGA